MPTPRAHWLDGEPITDVVLMSGIVDRYRRYVDGGWPVATGFVAVADAWACTNPSAGRGLTVGFLHAVQLRDVLRDALNDPRRLIQEFHARTEAEIAPWYRAQIAADRARFGQMQALREGREPSPPTDELAQLLTALFTVALVHPDLYRAALEYLGTITPIQTILARPGVTQDIDAAAAMAEAPPIELPGPDRRQLLELLS
jgi:2-polyprenyl-6-methoxyphenol hydroxylase-like FAD-dependent oxidoreductase